MLHLLSVASPKQTPEMLWSYISFNMPLGKCTATPTTLHDYYKGTLSIIDDTDNRFCLVNFDFKSSGLLPQSGNHTFKDGLSITPGLCCWTLPWFDYKISIDEHTKYDSENVSSVVDNALILLYLNGINPLDLLVASDCCFLLFGYNDAWLKADIRYVLSACCFFYGKHMLPTSNTISIDYFLYLCMENFYERLVPGCAEMGKRALKASIYTRNTKNFRSKYGKGKDKDKPITVTMGTGSRAEKHSISMTKFGNEIMNLVFELRASNSIRGIVKELGNRGITISKSEVARLLKKYDTINDKVDNKP